MRVIIIGGPRTGKSTLARSLGIEPIKHTDDLIFMGWSESSEEASKWIDLDGPWVIEGVCAVRALRKWFDRHRTCNLKTCQPCDRLVYLTKPRETRSPGQETMAKGVRTVLHKIEPWLLQRSIKIEKDIDYAVDNGHPLG